MTALRERVRLRHASLVEARVRRAARPVGVVLVYHRLAATSGRRDLELVPALDRSRFAAELGYLRRRYAIVAPSALPDALAARSPGSPIPVALSFDDDTSSHVDEALPLLDSAEVTAGFYLAGWSLQNARRPWWELLQAAADHGRLRPAEPPLSVDAVGAVERGEPGALRRLGRAIELLDAPARRSLEADLAQLTDGLPLDAGLDRAALGALASRHEIGFHTIAHARLASLDDESLGLALMNGRSELEDAIGRPVDAIAYPHGDADPRVADAARGAGYVLGLAGFNRAATAADDRLLLPRLDPWHTTLGTFALTLARATQAPDAAQTASPRS